jgi:hypothetical protein
MFKVSVGHYTCALLPSDDSTEPTVTLGCGELYEYRLRIESHTYPEDRFVIAVKGDLPGLSTHMLSVHPRSSIWFGIDTGVFAIDLARKANVFALNLPSPFSFFAQIDVDRVLVVYETGLSLVDLDGVRVWDRGADIIEEIRIVDDCVYLSFGSSAGSVGVRTSRT